MAPKKKIVVKRQIWNKGLQIGKRDGFTPAQVKRLNGAVVAALADPTVQRRLATIGQEIFPPEQQTPEALGALQKTEIEKWWPIIKAANIKGE
jgi:tripartite-type tricarboxylate transporter receptor subunit TctC